MILTSYFAIKPKDVKGGIGYRYVGLYGSLVKSLLDYSPHSKVFWYSNNDKALRLITSDEFRTLKSDMLKAILVAAVSTFETGRNMIVLIAYPYAVPKVKELHEYLLSLFILKILSLSCRVKIIVDNFDPPIENAYAFSEKRPQVPLIVYYRTLDLITLRLASFILVLSDFWRYYIAKIYHLKTGKILVCPNGALIRLIPYNPPKLKGSFTVLYAGSALKVKDIDNLINALASLKEKGLLINLHIAGAQKMDIPNWVNIDSYDWPTFVNNCLPASDICVIPYPPSRMAFYHSLPAKLFDYMAAGKPIISTNLYEVSRIITAFKCGLVAKDWDELPLYIEKLYRNRELARKLGYNGRKAAEKLFDYELLAETLLKRLINAFKVESL
jgi:glycosyltransferase involved in cell wall biosynthesis